MRRLARVVALIAVLALIAATCGEDEPAPTAAPAPTTTAAPAPTTAAAPAPTTAAAPAPTTAAPLEKITVRTPFKFNAYDMAYSMGVAQGFCEENGLDVTIELGAGSGAVIQTVASRQDDFAGVDGGVGMQAISNEDIPVKFLAVHLQKAPMGFITRPETPWEDPSSFVENDLVMVSSPGSGELTLLPAVLEQYGLTVEDINLQLVDFQARIPVWLEQGDKGVIAGFATGDLLRARAEVPDAEYDSYANYGITSYSVGVVTHTSMIEERPDIVRAFVDCVTRGYQYALDNPEEAVRISLTMVEDVAEDLLINGINVILDGREYETPATAGSGAVGTMSAEDWEAMAQLYFDLGAITEIKPTDRYFTNEFLPGG